MVSRPGDVNVVVAASDGAGVGNHVADGILYFETLLFFSGGHLILALFPFATNADSDWENKKKFN